MSRALQQPLGVILAGGLPAGMLTFLGMGMIVVGLWRGGGRHVAVYVVVHLLALSVMTALLVSFQALPFLVGGAVLARLNSAPAPKAQRDVLSDSPTVSDWSLDWTGQP